MPKLKSYFFILMLAAMTAVMFSSQAEAVKFTYYGSGFHSQSDASAKYNSDLHEPGVVADWDQLKVESYQEAEVDKVKVHGWGQGEYKIEYDNFIHISIMAGAHGYSESDIGTDGWAYGTVSTVEPAVTTGLFFLLEPDGGEATGDPVQVSCNWNGSAGTFPFSSARIGGGFTENLAITLNDYPAPSGFDPSKVVFQHDEVLVGSDVPLFDLYADGMFMAKIGDIVGVHMGVDASLDFENSSGSMGAFASSNMTLLAETPSPAPLPAGLWLLGSGLVGLGGWRKMRQKTSRWGKGVA